MYSIHFTRAARIRCAGSYRPYPVYSARCMSCILYLLICPIPTYNIYLRFQRSPLFHIRIVVPAFYPFQSYVAGTSFFFSVLLDCLVQVENFCQKKSTSCACFRSVYVYRKRLEKCQL